MHRPIVLIQFVRPPGIELSCGSEPLDKLAFSWAVEQPVSDVEGDVETAPFEDKCFFFKLLGMLDFVTDVPSVGPVKW